MISHSPCSMGVALLSTQSRLQVDPGLGPLIADQATAYFALLPNSMAINAGSCDGLPFDQRTVIWALNQSDWAAKFDYVLVMQKGRVVEQGRYDELARDGSALHPPVAAE